MAKKPKKTPTTIDPNKLKTRDHLRVKLLTGSTKGGAHQDRRREEDRRACRGRNHDEEE